MTFATPLPANAVSREYSFSDGLSIRQLPSVQWERAAARGYLSQPEIDTLRQVEYWLCGDWTHPTAIGIDVLRKAILACQIICPCGHDGMYLAFYENTGGVLDNVIFERGTALAPAFEGQLRELQYGPIDLLGTVFLRLMQAYGDRILRVVYPAELLFQGQRSANEYISPLLWTAALDMIFMSANTKEFAKRACSLFGASSYVFPKNYAGKQLAYTVSELAAEVYDFRSITAHGQAIPDKYLSSEELRWTGEPHVTYLSPCRRYELLGGAAASLLCMALRRILIDDLVKEVSEQAAWRARIKVGF